MSKSRFATEMSVMQFCYFKFETSFDKDKLAVFVSCGLKEIEMA